jgi:lysophospholipase L1-like esterase
VGDSLLALYIIADVVIFTIGSFALRRWPFRWRATGVFALAIVLAQPICGLLVDRLIEKRGLKSIYQAIFRQGGSGLPDAGSILYAEHHYLNYILNPRTTAAVAGQVNADFRIRRGQALRPRKAVKWRILALGGSTTYGDQLDRESDTWVFRLETKLRRSFGPDVEVINAGVPGYTVLDNFIHYVTLLTCLEPDLVLLYEGINDVQPRLVGQILPDYSNWRVPWRNDTIVPEPVSLLARVPMYQLYYVAVFLRDPSVFKIDRHVCRPAPPLASWPAALATNGTDPYRRHLENLLRFLMAQRREVVVIPQVYLPATAADEVVAPAVHQHNAVNEELAHRYNTLYIDGIQLNVADLFDSCPARRPRQLETTALVIREP